MKKRELTEKQQVELDFICKWLLEICDFLDETKLMETEDLRLRIAQGKSIGELSGAKEAYNDINSGMEDLPKHFFNDLNSRLKKRFGKDLFDADKKLAKKAKKIGERGEIRNEEEYRLLRAYLDSIEGLSENKAEYDSLYKLYFDFEMANKNTD